MNEPVPIAVSVVVPAYREAGRIGETVRTVRQALIHRFGGAFEILVVNDGSLDATAEEAAAAGARVIELPHNCGKGAALEAGLAVARGEILILMDADLRATASDALLLLGPILVGNADMTVATFPSGTRGGGFGLVRWLARWALRRAGGEMQAPLSGQRALRRETWARIGRLDGGFATEMGLNLDAIRLGLRVQEVPTAMAHRVTGWNWSGFQHRGRQFRDLLLAIVRRWPLRQPRPAEPKNAELKEAEPKKRGKARGRPEKPE